ncbi:biopolymer transporter ExbD [Candidatus Methylospira mobilis]|uniref:ExbD/TolR family protein n=1 Tax=Candidatus Methylospira mobilis TaxID=1808979 RepID=UPI0028EACEE9|nr:biopolymer transporter ExbD [Candidatus Methylospira mobilis]WNV06328.1 biopolymer transporter ExbD [Candidatus Methylospira mobilis]
MAFGGFNQTHAGVSSQVTEINMVPLIDVMLVLLIIFMITAPMLTHGVKIELPKASSQPHSEEAPHIALSIDGNGQFFWDNEAMDRAGLHERLSAAAQRLPQPELHLHVDKATAYQVIAEILADAAKAGVTRIGFVSDPNETAH